MLTGFGNEASGWDIEDTGEVGIGLFGNAVQVVGPADTIEHDGE